MKKHAASTGTKKRSLPRAVQESMKGPCILEYSSGKRRKFLISKVIGRTRYKFPRSHKSAETCGRRTSGGRAKDWQQGQFLGQTQNRWHL